MMSTKEGQLNHLYLGAWGLLWLIGMHYYQPNGGGSGLSIAFNNTSWMALALVIAVGCYQIARHHHLQLSALTSSLILTFSLLAIPLLWSASPWIAEVGGRYLALFALGLLVCIHQQFSLSDTENRWFWRLIIMAGLIQIGFSLLQFAFPEYFPTLITNQRPVGIFQQTNVAATFIGSVMVIAFYQSQQENTIWRQICWATVLLGMTVEVLILSRTGLLGTLLALTGMAALMGLKKTRRLWPLLALATLLALALQNLTSAPGRENLEQPGYRTTLYTLSAELIQEHPLSGTGLGSFQSAFMEKQAQHIDQGGEYPYWSVASGHPHNELLYWGVEGGLLPLIALLLFGLWVSWSVWRYGNRHHKGMWLCLFPILLHTQTEFPLYHSVPHLALFALLLSEMVPGKQRSVEVCGEGVLRLGAPIMVALVWAFMLTNLHTTYLAGQYFATKQPHYLSRIINPFAQEKNINMLTGEALIRIGSPAAFSQAVVLAEDEAKVRPSQGAYQLWLDALTGRGDWIKAEYVRQRGHYLFRDAPRFTDPIGPVISPPAARSPPASAAAPAR